MTVNRRLLQQIDRPMPKTDREWSEFVRALVVETTSPEVTVDVIGSAIFAPRNPKYLDGVAWGIITGTLSDQADLQTALNGKEPADADIAKVDEAEGITGAWVFSGTAPYTEWHDTDGTANKRRWRWAASGGTFVLQEVNDAGSAISDRLKYYGTDWPGVSGASGLEVTTGPIHTSDGFSVGLISAPSLFADINGLSVYGSGAIIGCSGTYAAPGNLVYLYHDAVSGILGCDTGIDIQASTLTFNSANVAYEQTGTISSTINGFTTNPTAGTWRWSKCGKLVTVLIPALTDTDSNAATMATVTALPTTVRPARTQTCICRVVDAGVTQLGEVEISTTGILTFGKGVAAVAGFTASGTKGVAPCAITYSMD